MPADALRALGYTDVAHLGDGFGAWAAAGRPVARVAEARPEQTSPPVE